MGFRPQHMVFSQKLSDLVAAYEADEETSDWFGEYCDMTSTSGYDNDGSIGPPPPGLPGPDEPTFTRRPQSS